MTDLLPDPCPLCDGTLPLFTYRWYCTECDALVKRASRKAGWKHWHKTSKGVCSVPMIYVQTLVSCPHQYADRSRDIALLNSWQPPIPTQSDLWPTEAEKTRKKRANKRSRQSERSHRQRIIDAGQTPVDPASYK